MKHETNFFLPVQFRTGRYVQKVSERDEILQELWAVARLANLSKSYQEQEVQSKCATLLTPFNLTWRSLQQEKCIQIFY